MNYLLLARGGSLKTARVLAVSADQRIVEKFLAELANNTKAKNDQNSEQRELHLVPGGEATDK